jgi:hypothetical protein
MSDVIKTLQHEYIKNEDYLFEMMANQAAVCLHFLLQIISLTTSEIMATGLNHSV